MSIVDLILLLLLMLFAVRGYFKGLFLEVFSLLGILAGILIEGSSEALHKWSSGGIVIDGS